MWLTFVIALQPRKPCRLRQAEYGYVCVCDDNYCDTLDIPEPKSGNEYVLVTSSESGDRFYYEIGKVYKKLNSNECPNSLQATLEIDSSKTYQKMSGFGGGYTGAVVNLVNKLSPNMKKCFYRSYFSQTVGIGYSHLRIPIGGCDFDLGNWAYNEYPEDDINLTNYTKLDERDLLRINQLKELREITRNYDIKLLAAAWSPPPWMKQAHKWTGKANNQIIPKYYKTWAEYHLKWLELMKKNGIDIWGISTGNEPSVSAMNDLFTETNWNASNQATWIVEHFGPLIKNSKFSNIQIHGYDDSRHDVIRWLNEMEKTNAKAFDYISAIDLHGYADNLTSPDILKQVQEKFPEKPIWYTEMCYGIGFMKVLTGPRLGLWNRSEELLIDIIDNLNNNAVGYVLSI